MRRRITEVLTVLFAESCKQVSIEKNYTEMHSYINWQTNKEANHNNKGFITYLLDVKD